MKNALKNPNIDWQAVATDPKFIKLHRNKNQFLWRMMLFALVFYFLLPLGTAYYQDFFRTKLWGVINIGLLFALLQFFVAWMVAIIYAKRAYREFDSCAHDLINDAHDIKSNP